MNKPEVDAGSLMDRAYDLLHRKNPHEALKIGLQLERQRYSGGFEIQARALLDLNRPEAATEALERGVEAVPRNWALWQFLGSCRSDRDDYDHAFEAYEHALACEGYEPEILYNYGTALRRAGRWTDAKERIKPVFDKAEIEAVEPPRLALYLVNLYEDILRHEGCHAEADTMIERYAGVIARAATAPG